MCVAGATMRRRSCEAEDQRGQPQHARGRRTEAGAEQGVVLVLGRERMHLFRCRRTALSGEMLRRLLRALLVPLVEQYDRGRHRGGGATGPALGGLLGQDGLHRGCRDQ